MKHCKIFVFSELLINNRDKLKESNSFVLTLQKDKVLKENTQRRINIRKISDLSDMVAKSYDKVSIELHSNYNLEELKEALKEEGKTEINLIIKENNKSLAFRLEKSRNFNLSTFNTIKNKEYVKKINF